MGRKSAAVWRLWIDRVERGEILTPSLTKRLTLTRSLASRLKGTEIGKTGLEGLGAE